jgi:hypothetical protein
VSTSNARIAKLIYVTRPHRWRLWLALVLQVATPLTVALAICLLAVTIAAQLVAIPSRSYWIFATMCCWLISVVIASVWRVRHLPSIWRQLDLAYGWQSALATALFFINAPPTQLLAAAQYQATLDLIATTPARQLPVWSRRMTLSGASMLLLVVGAWYLPTPFDAQIAQQRQFQQLAQSVAQKLQQLPPLVPIDATALATSPDAQTLVAQLNTASAQVARQAQASQQLQRLIPQLQHADPAQQQTLLAASQSILGTAQTTALQQALTQAQQGNPAPLQALADQSQRQSQAANQWQQALVDAKNQTLAQSQSGAPTSQSPTIPAPATTNQNSTSANQSGSSASQSGSSPSQSGSSASQSGSSQSGSSPSQSGSNPSQNGSSASQNGTGMGQPGGNGSGSGNGSTSGTQLFVPQVDGTQVLTIPALGNATTGQTVLRPNPNGGTTTAATQQYAAAVTDAARTANQAIVSNQIPWSGQATVRDYFAALQQEAP